MWIGLTDQATEGQFTWVADGAPLNDSFTPWAIGQPDNGGGVSGGDNCVATTSVHSHQWSDENCQSEFAPFCFKPEDAPLCAYKFHHINKVHGCYYWGHDTDGSTIRGYANALDFCQAVDPNAYVIELQSEAEAEAVKELLRSVSLNHGPYWWLGAVDYGNNTVNDWRWDHNKEPITYFDWGFGTPEPADDVRTLRGFGIKREISSTI